MKNVIDIEHIRHAQSVIKWFNSLDLSETQLLEDGKPIELTPECLEEWRFVGMTNGSFVELEFWKDDKEEQCLCI